MEYAAFDRDRSAAFPGGERVSRELRLTGEQVQYLAGHYSASVEPLGGQWYQVTFQGAMNCGS